MKKLISILTFISVTANAQNLKLNPQEFSDKTLLGKLVSEQAENGLAIVMDLSNNKIISLSSFVKKGNVYKKDTNLISKFIEPGSLMTPISAAVLIYNFTSYLNCLYQYMKITF